MGYEQEPVYRNLLTKGATMPSLAAGIMQQTIPVLAGGRVGWSCSSLADKCQHAKEPGQLSMPR